MTISAYEIQAAIIVADRATGPMERMLGLARDLTAQFERIKAVTNDLFGGSGARAFTNQLQRMVGPLVQVGNEVGVVKSQVTAGMDAMTAATATMTDAVRSLRDELAATAATARTLSTASRVGSAVALGGGHGGGGRGGGPHLGASAPVPFAPGMHVRSSHVGAAVAGAAALGFGLYENAQIQDAAAKILFTAGVPLASNMTSSKQYDAIRKMILDVSSETGDANVRELGNAALGVTRQMSGFPLAQRMAVMKTALEFGVQENMLKGTPLDEATESIIGLLHQTQTYDPAGINALAKHVAYLSLVTPMSLQQFQRATSYAMPVIQAGLSIDPDQLELTMAAMQRAGILSSKSGTWAKNALTREFVDTVTVTGHAAGMQREALAGLGLIDARGRSTVIDKSGHLDLINFAEQLQKAKASLGGPAMVADLQRAFGQQGAGFAAYLTTAAFIQQMPELQREMAQMPAAQAFFDQMFDASGMQQARDTAADFNVALIDLSNDGMPAATVALKALDGVLKGVNSFANGTGALGQAAQVGTIASIAAAPFLAWKGMTALGRGILSAFRIGSAASAGAAAGGAADLAAPAAVGAGLGAGAAAVTGLGIAAATAAATYASSQYLAGASGGKLLGMMPDTTGRPIYANVTDDPLVAAGEGLFNWLRSGTEAALGLGKAAGGDLLDRIDGLIAALTHAKAQITIELDGKAVGEATLNLLGQDGKNAPSGPSSFDPRLSPLFPNFAQ